MNKHAVTLARYAAVAMILSVVIVVVTFLSDIMGTYQFALSYIPSGGWPVLILTIVLFAFTTGIQLQTGGMSFDSGTIVYVAAIGAWMKLLGVKSEQSSLVRSFDQVAGKWGGPAWILLFTYPSLIFDVYTDFVYLSGTVFFKIAWVGALSSLMAEQFLMLLSVSITMVRAGYPAKGGDDGGGGGGRRRGDSFA